MAIVPDSKDWTWVLGEPCPECGFDARAVDVGAMDDLVLANAARWPGFLARGDAATRPSDDRWSALEYACHVRDVFGKFDERLALMLTEDGPHFANWDQDVTADEEHYGDQDPSVVAGELVAAAEAIAARFRTVADDQWERTGFRSDGAAFTVDSVARYFLHDPEHHVWDVEQGNTRLDG
jgi:hypothetical protein